MDERLKQRLVGAAVIVALAAIFIPMILEGPDDDMGPVGSNLPASPDYEVRDRVEPLVLPPPPETEPDNAVVMEEKGEAEAPATQTPTTPEKSATAVEPAEPAPARASPSATEPTSEPEPQTATTQQPEVSGWVVQVGSFSKQSNALGLRDRLRGKGYSAFVEEARTDDGVTYRVRVGPEIERTEADRLQTEIAKTFKLKGIVTHYP